jgi:hypothetical protein
MCFNTGCLRVRVLHGTLEYMLLTLVFARSSWQQVAKNEPTNDNSDLSENHLTFVQDNVHQCNRMEVVNNHVISVIFPIDEESCIDVWAPG